MTAQLPLGLSLRQASRFDDFVAGDNGVLLDMLAKQLHPAGEPLIYISGEPGSGRSHLLLAQCDAAERQRMATAYLPMAEAYQLEPAILAGLETLDLLAIDDVDDVAGDHLWEEALFGFFNSARDAGCRLLVSAGASARATPFQLPDLRSRLSWGISYHMKPLDDNARKALVIALAARRGLELPDEAARYLLERIPRDSGNMNAVLDALDTASLAHQRRLTIPFISKVLSEAIPPA